MVMGQTLSLVTKRFCNLVLECIHWTGLGRYFPPSARFSTLSDPPNLAKEILHLDEILHLHKVLTDFNKEIVSK